MLGIGQHFPTFSVKATVSTDLNTAFQPVNNSTYKGKWLVVFFLAKRLYFCVPHRDCGIRTA